MKTTIVRACAAFSAACAVWLASASPCAAETNVRNPKDPAQLLEYAETQAEILKQKAAAGEIPGAEYRAFDSKVAAFRNWYNCAQMDPVWTPGSPVMLRLSPDEFDFNEGNIGPDVGLAGNIETTMTKLANPVAGTRIQVGYDVQNPINPGFAVYYLLGTYTNDVVLVAPGAGYWAALPNEEYLKLCNGAKTLGGSAVVDQQQFNRLLVDIYKDVGLPVPTGGGDGLPAWLLIVIGVVALLVVLLAIILAARKKSPPVPVPTCRDCGSPLGPDGRCPAGCDDRVAPPPPVPVPEAVGVVPPPPPPVVPCPNCGSALVDGACPNGCTIPRCPHCDSIMKDGVCPVCGEIEPCPSCGSDLIDGICPNGCTIVRCPVCNKVLVNGLCPKGCNAKALSLGWSGSAKPTMSPWKLEVVAPSKHASEVCELPFEAVLGRSASEKKTTETYIQLHFDDKRKASACSRRYVKLVCDPSTKEVTAELLSTSGRAVVDGKTLSSAGDKAPLGENGTIELTNAGYKLRLVRA